MDTALGTAEVFLHVMSFFLIMAQRLCTCMLPWWQKSIPLSMRTHLHNGGVPDKPTDKMNHEKMENYMNFKLKIQDYFVVA